MTEDLIAMAKQAGLRHDSAGFTSEWSIHSVELADLEAFAALIEARAVARTREECALIADEYATWGGSNFYDWFKKLAAAIRALGERT